MRHVLAARTGIRSFLPRGGALPVEVWDRRHRGVLVVLWVHVAAFAGFAALPGAPGLHVVLEASVVAALAALSRRLRAYRRLSTAAAAIGLLTCSAILVHLSGGVIEMHFHFFVMIALVSLFHEWTPFLIALAYVVLHHGIGGALFPEDVYNHPAAIASPWKWAGIHGLFILATSSVSVVSWRLDEGLRAAAVIGERQLADAQRLARLGSWEWHVPSGGAVWSDELYRLFGLAPGEGEASLERFMAIVHPDDRTRLDGVLERCARTGDAFGFEFRAVLPDGATRWFHGQGELVESAGGAPVRMAGTVQDLSERKAQEERLERSREVSRLVHQVTAAANQAQSFEAVVSTALDEVCAFTGWPVGHVYQVSDEGRELVPTSIWHLDDRTRFRVFCQGTESTHLAPGQGLPGTVLATGKPAWEPDLSNNRAAPRYSYAVSTGLRAGFAFPVVVGDDVVAVLEFFSVVAMEPDSSLLEVLESVGAQLGRVVERRRAERELAHQAMHDPLTGLPNRALFLDRVSHAVSGLGRSGTRAAVLFLDLDGFKLINDSLGHEAGDEVLVTVAQRLQTIVRQSDTVARLGGDEFTILCEDLASDDDAVALAERIGAALRVPLAVRGRELNITTSVGIAYAGRTTSTDDLMQEADMAMYRAKHEGRDRYALFDTEMHAAATRRLEISNALRHAVDRDELRLHYQPKVDLDTGRLIGVEALLRWEHPENGLLGPNEFVGVAEESGLVVGLGNWVVREACRQAAEWDASSPALRGIEIALNVSGRQIETPELLAVLSEAIEANGLAPERLCLEMTESVLMGDAKGALDALAGLKALGVRLAVDDFGTGYSSLSYLQRFPVDTLKVDKSFVTGMAADPSKQAIVRSVIDLAHALQLDVVAEGVETSEEARMLVAFGCDDAQGYHFGRPGPAEVIESRGRGLGVLGIPALR